MPAFVAKMNATAKKLDLTGGPLRPMRAG